MSSPPAAFRPRIRDVLRIAVAAVGITAGLAGVPLLLWWAAGALHYPTDVEWLHLDHNVQAPPVDEQVRTWLYDTYHALRLGLGADGFLILAVLAFGGLAWLRFVWLTLVELVLLARDGTELLLERTQQVGVRGWIASLLTTLALSTPAHAAGATAAPTTAATAPPQPGTPDHSDDRDTTSAATTLGGHADPPPTSPTTHLPDELRPDCPRYRVHAGDSLIRIAQQHLGDVARWRELAELNQPWLANPNQLAPGWQLLLPPDAPAPEQPEVTEITISYGDTLASLAEHHLHDPDRLGELFDLNAGRTQPDGLQLADPNILLAGWKLLVPLDNEPQQSRDAPLVAPPDAPSVTEHETGAPAASPATAEDGGFSLGHGVFLGVGLAAAISLALTQARARHRRHQHPDNDLSDLPVAPTVSALRLAHLRTTEPDTRTARSTQISGGSESFGTTEDSTEPSSSDACPGLVVEIGTRHDRTVTLDLATCGGLGISGPAQDQIAHAMLLHLLSRHSTHTDPPVQIVLTRPEAEWLLPTDETPETVRIVDELASALDLLEHTLSDPDHPPRAAYVVMARTPVEQAHRLRNLLRGRTAPALGAVLLGPWPDGTTVITDRAARVVHTQPDTAVSLDGTRLFTATPHATRQLLPLTPTPQTRGSNTGPAAAAPATTTADEPDTEEREAVGTTTSVPEHNLSSTEPDTVGTAPNAPITLQIFGPATVIFTDHHGNTRDLTSNLTTRQRDLVVYLALHPDGISRDTLITDLWHEPGRHRPTNAFNTLLSRLRGTVSRATAGAIEDLVDTVGTGRYRLSPVITTDYAAFLQHAARSHRTHDTDPELGTLDEIVRLYTGSLAADIDTEWIQAPRQHAQRTFINAVSTLANHRVQQQPQQTLGLLESAVDLDPYNEALYRDIMRLNHQLGMPHSITHTLDSLTLRLADIDAEPTIETTTLAHQLRNREAPNHPMLPS